MMIKKIIVIMIIPLVCIISGAFTGAYALAVNVDKNLSRQTIGKFIEYLEDRDGKLRVEDVSGNS
jgi:hypothetical protein